MSSSERRSAESPVAEMYGEFVRALSPVAAAVVPCWIDDDAQPVPVGAGDERGVAVAEYLRRITVEADLATRWEWDGDLLRVV
ncbi:hypothetical protein [Microbacterium sp. 10M-3C3]|jgi:hypothetical protein|uniref:hypothetical protein n=1 Tax=Microbacterium sp. 10M-3C3 TaxID=2483401 RepID=UPI001F0C77C4|nr:hypothetical protein [Microbacterium sp. 10M-3C3]